MSVDAVFMDCWETVLVNPSGWAGTVVTRVETFLAERGNADRRSLHAAFQAEGKVFRKALLMKETTHQVSDRLSFIASSLEISLSQDDHVLLCREVEQCISQPLPTPVPGVEEFLARLERSGIPVCIVCNTGWSSGLAVRAAFDALGLARYFQFTVFSDEVGAAKPSRAIFDHALQLTGSEPHATVHIGDRWFADVVGAQNAGLHAVHLARKLPASVRDGVAILPTYEEIHDHLVRNLGLT